MRQSIAPELMRQFLDQAVRAGNAWGLRDEIGAACVKRLEVGAEEYGPNEFWGADIPRECADESADLIEWPHLDWIRLLAYITTYGNDEATDEYGRLLQALAAHGASAYRISLRLRELDRESLRLSRPELRPNHKGET